MSSLALLLLVPLSAAPIQALYLKAGGRYDIGAGMYVVLGAILAGILFPPSGISEQAFITLQFSLVAFGTCCAVMFIIRVLALVALSPMKFTLVSLAQMWATVPLLNYSLQRHDTYSGLYVGNQLSPMSSLVLALILAVVSFKGVELARMHIHLRAFTDSPDVYRLSFDRSVLSLCLRIELVALVAYLAAGLLFGLCRNTLSPGDFGPEILWMLLAACAIPFYKLTYVIAVPSAVILLRLVLSTYARADTTMLLGYFSLAIVLVMTGIIELRRLRVSRG